MTPEVELAELVERIADTEYRLVLAREALEEAAGRLVLEGDSDGLGAARALVAELRDRLEEQISREAVLRFRLNEVAA